RTSRLIRFAAVSCTNTWSGEGCPISGGAGVPPALAGKDRRDAGPTDKTDSHNRTMYQGVSSVVLIASGESCARFYRGPSCAADKATAAPKVAAAGEIWAQRLFLKSLAKHADKAAPAGKGSPARTEAGDSTHGGQRPHRNGECS